MARNKAPEKKAERPEVDPYAVASISPSYLMFKDSHGICGEDYVRPLNIDKWPYMMPLGWASGFVASDVIRAPVAMVMEPIMGDKLAEQINRTVNQATPQPGDGMLTYTERQAKDFQAANAAEINSMLLNENARLFDTTVYIDLRAKDLKELAADKDLMNDLVFKTSRAKVEKQLSNTRAAFFASSPCVADDPAGTGAYAAPMPSETIAMAELVQSFGFDDGEGVLIGTDKHGGPVRANFTSHNDSRPNGNILLCAESGNGKSTLMKHINLHEHLLYGANVCVISDPEREYTRMAGLLGGEVSDPIGRLSPFEPRNIATESTFDDGDGEASEFYGRALEERVLSNHIPFLKTFLQMAFPLIDDETAAYLGYPITQIYGLYGITPETTFREYFEQELPFPVMEDLYRELRAEAEEAENGSDPQKGRYLRRAAQAIEDAAVGYDKYMWNSRERFATGTTFTVIDTSNLSADENVKSAQLYNILMWAWSQVRSHRFGDSYTRIVMDELNSVVNAQNPAATAQIAEMVRRVRKYNAGVMFAVQVINSLLDPKVGTNGEIILDNCVYKFFGSASGGSVGTNLWQTQQYLSLTDKVTKELGAAGRGNFIMSVGKRDKTWVRVDAIEPWELDMFGKGGGR